MQLPIAIHKDEGSVYGVTVPDVPGCFSSGETLDEAINNAREAIYGHLEVMLEDGEGLELKPSSVESLIQGDDYLGAIWAMVDVDLSSIDPKPERVNISVPRYLLRRIDQYAKEHRETRSGFLVRAALSAMQ